MIDKANVSIVEELGRELNISATELQAAIDKIRERHNLKNGQPLIIEVPAERVTTASYIQKTK